MASKQYACQDCSALYFVSDKEQAFLNKLQIPNPVTCFECGQKQRLSFRNSSSLYNRKCDHSGEAIISIYAPDKPYKVYKSDYWFSDKWDAADYGQEIDFSRPLFPQLKELQLKVPRLALLNFNAENSDYCNSTVGNKNCYLIFGGDHNQDCLFGNLSMHNEKVVDSDVSNQNKVCYMMSDCTNCYQCQFAFDCKSCSNCFFISDCSNCQDCILCTNLHNKQFCINNEQLSKEAYQQKANELLNGSRKMQKELMEQFQSLRSTRTVKFSHMVSCEDSSGDYLKSCKGCHNCFDSSESEDLSNVIFATKAKDTHNSSMLGDQTELSYDIISTSNCYNSKYSFGVLDSSNVEYSDLVLNCHDLFGCVCLKGKEYAILNKVYSKTDFNILRSKLIEHMKKTGEWGKFLPKELSCFGYNESCAQEYYPLTKEEALKSGFSWYEKDNSNSYQGPDVIIADNIKDITDSITKDILTCITCHRNYRVVPQELSFYREQNIPVPQSCYACRYKFRQSLRNPRILWDRTCMNCDIALKTTYAPERSERILCEACYLKETY
ncbi:MAG: hypothetical protein HY817_04225 [Candidatus Abawacabacteria bacterium]|nr:hypothetical protein [Candidatus Abawacabacteria bacterium]